ncbi:MAG TPA: prolyl oligopeptidase family serine peptidase [Flavobacteriales bacterium]|nr:prolyl oligopeptidase family serine peptidase [Flavobacteriales bacterium]HMW96142.1 prolyl oligopeptidase family serine peptidase [Flavobacteriales bacterium]HMZ47590.1 prolyl oligopeptidase family serine peptidase [Flavobacteriales bacterium]HNI03822.1 prolyl oligopeptidase family serine peptidase [Flavobacteriales bacterium]HNK68964.1 prolyl oligopeptidase family serine peptidase [Flavobacteriales bacterium]
MNKNLLLPCVLLMACGTAPETAKQTVQKIDYPTTRKDSTAGDTLHGVFVADPYRWLENDTSAETAAWVKAQNAVTSAYIDSIPYRDAIAKRYEELYNYPKLGGPMKVGDLYFIWKNSGLQNQFVINVRKGLDGEDQVFIDPNAVDPAGTTTFSPVGSSNDHRYMAVGVQKAGSDWQDITVYDLSTLKQLPDVLKWAKFSGAAWYKDGFFYSRYPEPAKGTELSAASKFQKVYYHKLGDPQEKDALVWENKENGDLYVSVGLTEGEEFASLTISTGTDGYETYFHDMRGGVMPTPATRWIPLQQGFDHKTSIVDFVPATGKFLVMTEVDAPNYRLVEVDPTKPEVANWKDIIPHKKDLLQGVSTGGGILFAEYLKDATSRFYRYQLDGTGEQAIALPDIGSAGGFGGERNDTFGFYSFTSFTDPGSIYKYDYATGKSELWFRPELKFDPSAYVTEQVFYPSKDGTKVPMFIVHKKGTEKNGHNPTLLYAYGGFNISLSPSFSVSRMLLLEQGGVFALANLRGGGEYGEDWHRAGMKEKKQNVFDDFIAAAEYLIKEKWTDTPHLGVNGGSNGGLLIGAVETQRPDLFGVCFPEVGVLDMLRYQKFTAGFGWTPEYGNADNSPEEFAYLRKYSPLHNIKPAKYPATLVMTADHDDRVVPAHSFKFISTLQPAQQGDAPVLIRVAVNAGHGAGKPTSMIIDEQADKYAFFFKSVGFTPEYGTK